MEMGMDLGELYDGKFGKFAGQKGYVVVYVMPLGTGPTSEIISRWVDHTSRMASGVPIPAARGSPQGPNQWFCGAPVVRARIPA